MDTEQRTRAWLSAQANVNLKRPALKPQRGFEYDIHRNYFVTSNGIEVSIQQGASHYCDKDSVEMWHCPHHPILDAYGSEDENGCRNPYGWVPVSVVARYIDILEGQTK